MAIYDILLTWWILRKPGVEARLDSAVTAGKITADQRSAILATEQVPADA